MKVLLIIGFGLFSFFLSNAQDIRRIVFPYSTTINVKQDTLIGGEHFYDIEFYNIRGELIKTVQQYAVENHNVNNDYCMRRVVKYHFYENGRIVEEVAIEPQKRILSKTTYKYLLNGKLSEWVHYDVRNKLSQKNLEKQIYMDTYLNNPEAFPKRNVNITSRQKYHYQAGKIIGIFYYEEDKKNSAPRVVKEQHFKYDRNGRLISYTFSPKSPLGGTSGWKTLYRYDINGKVLESISYENNRLYSITEYNYTDSQIIEFRKRPASNVNQSGSGKFSINKTVYKLNSDGNFYNEEEGRWWLCKAADI